MTAGHDPDPDVRAGELARAHGDGPTAWFEPLYREVAAGRARAPWDRGQPQALLTAWLDADSAPTAGRALVVGAGLGDDAVLLARRGFAVTAFDVSPTAVELARTRATGTMIDFAVADLLDPPPEWDGAFDLVVEIYTVQSMPRDVRSTATTSISRFVAPGGTLLVIMGIAGDGDWAEQGPPWPLTRDEIDAFADDRLAAESVDQVDAPSGGRRWRAVFTCPAELRRRT